MNFQLVKTLFVATCLFLCHKTEQLQPKNGTKTNATIMKAFLMQCPEISNSENNIQVTVQIAVHSTSNTNNDSFVGKILLGDDSNQNFACDLKAPSLVEVSNVDFVLMYPFKFQTTLQTTADITNFSKSVKETVSAMNADKNTDAKTNNNLKNIESDKDVLHTANNVKLLDDIYKTRLNPSDFLKRSDFMHTNPKDFRRDSICTKHFRKDNNKNNANNEYANEEFYGDKSQRENENAFSGKFGMNSNNNDKIDNIKSNKKYDKENNILNDIGHFTQNWFADKDSWKRRKKISEHKNDFIKCVGMKNFKKIDHVLCTCARNVDEVNADETAENNDEQSDCFQLINNVCLWGPPVYNKNINYEMKMDEDIRNVNYGIIKSTAFACCDLLSPFYFTLGKRCYNIFIKDDLYDEVDDQWIQFSDSSFLDELPEIIKNESDDVLDETTSYLRSNMEKDEKMIKKQIHSSGSLLHSPKYNLYSRNPERFPNKEMKNRLNGDRLINIKTVPFGDTVADIVKIISRPVKQRNFQKKETKPFDRIIYDPHLNIADKMQLIDMINPKRPCERNRMNNRQKRHFDLTDPAASLTDDELDSALESYEYPDSELQDDSKTGDYSEINDAKQYGNNNKNTSASHTESVKKVQKICSQHLCALAMPFKKDPYFRGEITFLGNNGSKLNSNRMAENICHDHFHEFVLIPFEYANNGEH